MINLIQLKENVALITGAAGGIGKEIAKVFGESGCDLILTDINKKELNKTSEEIKDELKVKVSSFEMDVTDSQSVKNCIEMAVRENGKIDILVNAAGVSTMNEIINLEENDWDFVFDVNVKGVFLVSKYVAQYMVKRNSGKIINIASMAGRQAARFLVHYSASKFAVIGFTEGLAIELARYKINVNAICPAFVKTSMQEREIEWESYLRGISPEEVRNGYVMMTPLGRLETPNDVAKVALFLGSPLSDFITGEAINVTGGALLY